MKALVFGATGLIGSHLVQKLLKEGADVTGVSSGNNKKDIHSKRGLLKMVSKRRKMLDYLSKTDEKKYKKVIKELGLKR